MLAALIVCVLPAGAQSAPAGELLDILPVARNSKVICSFYLRKGRVKTFLSRVDGKKLEGKRFWNLASARKRLAELEESHQSLVRRPFGAAAATIQEAEKSIKQLGDAKRYLAGCEKSRGRLIREVPPVKFGHVKSLIKSQCMNCHGVLGWENSQEFFSDSGRVVAGDREASPFYVFLSNNPEGFLPGYMPKGVAPLSDLNIKLLGRWIDDIGRSGPLPTPTPAGPEGEGRGLYATNCAACHGPIDFSAKWGRSQAEILEAIRTVPQMRYLRLSNDQIAKIATALSRVRPPQEGSITVRSLGPAVEGAAGEAPRLLQFEVALAGASSRPFSVGYVTSNGTALAGSDFEFTSGTLAFEGRSGETKVVDVPVFGDNFQEADETLFFDIGGVTHGGVRIATSTAQATIVNDDVVSEVAPPVASQIRLALGFNGNYNDAISPLVASAVGSPVLSTTARVGTGSLELASAADYVGVPGQNIQGATSFTLTAWTYWQNGASTSSRVFDFGNSTTNYIYFLPRDTAGRCRFEMRFSGSATYTLQCPANMTLPQNSWAHLATTYNASNGEMKIYLGGQLVASRTGVALSLPTLAFTDNRIGKSRVTSDIDFQGRIDEVMVWDAALSQSDISAVMAMTQSTRLSSGIELRLNNQLIANNTTIDFGNVPVGEEVNLSLFVTSRGPGGLELTGAPVVRVAGQDANKFVVKHQVWPWQELLGRGAFAVFSLRHSSNDPGEKHATLVLENSDIRDGNFAATLAANNTGDPILDLDPETDPSSELGQGQQLYVVNCASCHGALSESTKRGITAEQLAAAIDPTNGIVQMRSLAFTPDQIRLIVLALASTPPASNDQSAAENANISIGTAPYVASFLSEMFLPDDPATYTADDNTIRGKITESILGLRTNLSVISQKIRHFGGRCDRFEDDPDNASDLPCQDEALMSSQTPVANAVRTALIIRVCDEVLSIDRAVDNIVAKIGRSSSAAVDAQSLRDLFQRFYPGKQMPQYLSEVMANYTQGSAGFSARDHWRFQAHLMCASTDWEAL